MATSEVTASSKPMQNAGSFAGLLTIYDFSFPEVNFAHNYYGDNLDSKAQQAPLYYTAGGRLRIDYGFLSDATLSGRTWGNTITYEGNEARNLAFFADTIFPAVHDDFWYGYSRRTREKPANLPEVKFNADSSVKSNENARRMSSADVFENVLLE